MHVLWDEISHLSMGVTPIIYTEPSKHSWPLCSIPEGRDATVGQVGSSVASPN